MGKTCTKSIAFPLDLAHRIAFFKKEREILHIIIRYSFEPTFIYLPENYLH